MVIFNTKNCTGCRTCEIACSFHHIKAFAPSISSIEIANSLRKDQRITILFYVVKKDGHFPCDGCRGEEEPYCVKYCNILARDELRGFLSIFQR